ncbi:MAG: ABC transporter substrate-binding protein [Actinomycetota bacterium]|nr:ABC transporter substrate-binding protein [Actinomycetota bacterium]
MRRLLLLLGLVLFVSLTAACGDDDGDDAAGSTTSTSSATTGAEDRDDGTTPEDADDDTTSTTSQEAVSASYPVTIEHALGSTTIEARPDRIVTLNVQWTDAVLAMGEQPVGYVLSTAAGEAEPYPWQSGLLDGSTVIETPDTVPFEQIAALDPDLILVTFLASEDSQFETLEEIAPTIGLLGGREVDPWQAQVETLGTVLGEPEDAADVIADVEGQVAAMADELPGLDGATYTMANYVPGTGIYVIADPEDGSSKLFYDLGMEIDPEILELDAEAVGRLQISFEQIGLLDADLMCMLLNGTDPAEVAGLSELGAVAEDAFISFQLADIVGLNTPTPISVPYLLDLMRPTLEIVAAGA